MTPAELRDGGWVSAPVSVEPERESFVAVFRRDDISYQWECGLCGMTMRGYANSLGCRAVADVHEANCPERAKED